MNLRPFFCYYGGKWRCAKNYPFPVEDTIIEPFAGAAGYSTRHPHKKVILVDKYDKVIALWQYLIRVSEDEILSIPSSVQHTDELAVEEQKHLVGFWMNKGTCSPRKSPSSWMRGKTCPDNFWGDAVKKTIASQVQFIRHWKAKLGGYEYLENKRATWFIDPPYQGRDGQHYRHNSVDYKTLSGFAQTREGQVIVCEQEGADWLPFNKFMTIKTNPSKRGSGRCHEVIWTNDPMNDPMF